jgi:hypothetical protein
MHDGDAFICACEEWVRDACRGEGFYKEHDGKRYCVLHYPGTEKKEAFAEALQRKLGDNDFDFGGVWFPDFVDFQVVPLARLSLLPSSSSLSAPSPTRRLCAHIGSST